ncbi:Hypothetical predicted protein [Mytilus galloprovincialis]|uniref:Uncharacterized protein n=1 Tax=Mytilus galloprovincialis TaxID=29158 RepID=A0A8B6BQC6_MYTGA|nr:Hypothetical predicted protein [Mytilus galloprovincialis]
MKLLSKEEPIIHIDNEIGYGGHVCFLNQQISIIITFIAPIVLVCCSNVALFSLFARTIASSCSVTEEQLGPNRNQSTVDVSHNTNSSKTYNDAVKLGLIPKDYLNGEPHVNIHETLSSVKPVFILETDLFGEVKPSPDQFLTHLELYNSIDSCIPKSHLKGLQRVRGMWRIYPDSDNDRETLITKKIIVRNKLINVYSTNPKSSEYSSLLYLRVRVKDVPCSADDGQILRAIENEGKCTVHKLNRERLRVDGLRTECQTG